MLASFIMRYPLLSLFDSGNQGHIGVAVAVSNSIAEGYLPPFYRGWVRAQAYCRLQGKVYNWTMPHYFQD